MLLRAKTVLILISALSLLGFLSIGFFLQVIRPSFLTIEEQEATRDLQRVIYSITNETNHLNSLNHDWAAWDVTYDFMRSGFDDYVEENLPVSSFTDNSLNVIHFYDVEGKLIWGEARDLETEELINIESLSRKRLPEDHLLFKFAFENHPLSEVAITGLWMTEHGAMLISSRPILDNNNEGPVQGTLLMGRFLDDTVVEKLNQQTRVKFNVVPIDSDTLSKSVQNLQMLDQENSFYIERKSDAKLNMFATFPDLKGNAGVLIRADKKREIYEKSQTVMKYTIVSILLSIVTVFVFLSISMQKIIIGPLNSLTQHVLEIGHSGNLTSQITVRSKDEIGILAKECNAMTAKLYETKNALQEQSFQLGMAELASGIMHNLRNTLHVLFINIEKLRKTVENVPVEQIAAARKELGQLHENENRKADIIDFLDTTNTSLLAFIARTKTQLDAIKPLADEMETVLKNFEKWAYRDKVEETILVESLIHESNQFLHVNYRDSISLIVKPGVKNVGHIKANRILLIQVLINLLTNAAESISRVQGQQGEISFDAMLEKRPSGEVVHITLCDNGEGMDNDVLPHIFKRGFTTKNRGKTGLGLHWCANATEKMDGELYAENTDFGQGACFHLLLPKKDET